MAHRRGYDRRWSRPKGPAASTDGLVPSQRCPEHDGKLLWPTRKGAKRAIRGHSGEERAGMREYRCVDRGGFREGWHIGHNAAPIMNGEITARELYNK